VALNSEIAVHQRWGMCAAGGYALAAAAVAAPWQRRGTDLALLASIGGALLAPLCWLAASGTAQREVYVISRSAWMLIHHGTPYRSVAELAATQNPDAYNPYMPLMSVFGLGQAIAGGGLLTDPRVWFTVAFAVLFPLALRASGAVDVWRWAVLVMASPLIAFPLSVGGDDVPVLGLMCLGLALLSGVRRPPRHILAGLALGAAAALKATAWPVALVALALVTARDGRRAAVVFAASAAATCALLVAPPAAVAPGAFVVNTIRFPLGMTGVKSGAASRLPGYLIAHTGHAGEVIAIGLAALAVAGIGVWLAVRPPRDVSAATWRAIVALIVLFTLAPATRVGYYIYPLTLWVWLRVSALGARARVRRTNPAPVPGRIRLRT